MLKFYAILDIDGYMETDNIPIDVLLQSRDIPYIKFTTFPESVTISKIDHIKKFSGLSEIKIHIPEKIIKRFKMNYIRCEISYTVRNNFKLTNNIENCDYNFFIYPNNYGRGMEKCSIKVFVPKDENYGIVCHHFCVGNVADKLLDFYPDEKENNKGMHQIIFSGSFIPQKNTAYFINLKKL